MYTDTEQRSRERVQALAAQLYRDHHGRLFAIARKNAANPSDAEEAVQFGFLAFIEHFDPAGEAPALPWVTLTVKRRCWALYREAHLDRSVGQEVAPGSEGPGFSLAGIPTKTAGPEEAIERAEYVFEARERLGSLKPAERTALLLFGFGYTYREIGEQRDWSYTKVNRSITEGRARLRANAATEQPQTHRRGGEIERVGALASRPAKKEEAVNSSDLDPAIASEVAR